MKVINGDINLSELYFKEIPEVLKDIHVKNGNFVIINNRLSNLNNSPQKVDGIFNCGKNKLLKSFNGGPKEVGGLYAFDCGLTSLEGFPKILSHHKAWRGSVVDISHNKLTSLVGLPKSGWSGNLCIYYNNITSLEGCPEHIRGDFEASHIPITNMIGGPQHVSGHCLLNNTYINTLEGFPTRIGGNIFIGNTPLWEKLSKKYGRDKAKEHIKIKLMRVGRFEGYVYEDEEDFDNQDFNNQDVEDQYEY